MGATGAPNPEGPVYLRDVLPLSADVTVGDHARPPVDRSSHSESKHRLDVGRESSLAVCVLNRRPRRVRLEIIAFVERLPSARRETLLNPATSTNTWPGLRASFVRARIGSRRARARGARSLRARWRRGTARSSA